MSDYPHTPRQKSKTLGIGIFQRCLWREFATNGLLVSVILLGIVSVSLLIRLLGDAVSGQITVDAVLVLLALTAINYMSILLSIGLFISVLLTLSRLYRDSEMVIWHNAGIGLQHWIRPTLMYALPVVAVIALFSLVLSPWALNQVDIYKKELENRDDVAAATPGIFRESRHANRVYFIEDVNVGSNRVGNIFVQSQGRTGKQSVMVAKEGLRETLPNGERYLVLFNGTRYEGIPGQQDYTIIAFERYAMRIDSEPPQQGEPRARAMSTFELLDNVNSWRWAELVWRLGIPLSALLLVLLAIPLSFVNPRAGRSFNLIVAIVLYVIYNNLLSVSNAWIGQQKMPVLLGLLWVHVLMLMVTVGLFYHRMSLGGWQRGLRRWLGRNKA